MYSNRIFFSINRNALFGVLLMISVERVTRQPLYEHMYLIETDMLVLAHTPIPLELTGKADI